MHSTNRNQARYTMLLLHIPSILSLAYIGQLQMTHYSDELESDPFPYNNYKQKHSYR